MNNLLLVDAHEQRRVLSVAAISIALDQYLVVSPFIAEPGLCQVEHPADDLLPPADEVEFRRWFDFLQSLHVGLAQVPQQEPQFRVHDSRHVEALGWLGPGPVLGGGYVLVDLNGRVAEGVRSGALLFSQEKRIPGGRWWFRLVLGGVVLQAEGEALPDEALGPGHFY